MQLSDWVQIGCTVITAVVTIVCGIILAGRPGVGPRRSTTLIIAIVAFFIFLGLLGWQAFGSQAATEVKITHPTGESRVAHIETVRGTTRGIPTGHVVWVVVFAHEVGRYYPQDRAASAEARGRWSSVTYLGLQGDAGKGKTFDILAVLVDDQARRVFGAYIAEAKEHADWPDWYGLEGLPTGVVIWDRVTVTRR